MKSAPNPFKSMDTASTNTKEPLDIMVTGKPTITYVIHNDRIRETLESYIDAFKIRFEANMRAKGEWLGDS